MFVIPGKQRRVPVRELALGVSLCLLMLFAIDRAQSQEGDWIYDIFVKECQKAGGRAASSLEAYKRGEPFRCDQGSTGSSQPSSQAMCETEAKESVDWVFRDGGARGTYDRALREGRSPFESVFHAQGHNPSAQDTLTACRPWVEAYLSKLGAKPDTSPLGKRKLSAKDCRCISVEPVGRNSQGGRAIYRVTNSCDGMYVTVHFDEDNLSTTGGPALSTTADAGLLTTGQQTSIQGSGRNYTSIKGYDLENAASRYACRF